eukprot:Gb_17909 [translate_table: standard]
MVFSLKTLTVATDNFNNDNKLGEGGFGPVYKDSQMRIIHRDIKASSILLDENLNPKIADFRLANIFPEGDTYVSTRVASTYRRKNTDFDLSPEMQSLLGWAWRLQKEGRLVDVIDRTLMATCPDQDQALRCLQIGLLCGQADAAIRPRMCDVNWMLNNSERLADPKKPAFFKYVNHNQNSTFCSGHQELQRVDGFSRSSGALPHYNLVTCSKNEISISELQPR